MPIVMVRTPMRTHPAISKKLGELEMILVIPANAPSVMAILQAGSVASSNLSSIDVGCGRHGPKGLDQFC